MLRLPDLDGLSGYPEGYDRDHLLFGWGESVGEVAGRKQLKHPILCGMPAAWM